MTTTYLTVAIPYVNAAPHLGYAYELVLADACARARRALPGAAVRFLGGTDDYSLKNVLAAEAARVPTADFVAANAERFAALAVPLSLSFDDFVRTSADDRHVPAVQHLWRAVGARGDLYRRAYEGSYCVGCEQFYEPSELVRGCCPEHGTAVDQVAEENWFFRLSAYQGYLEQLIGSGELRVTPPPFRAEALSFVRSGLQDISVSRSARRARGWGVPVPGDPSQVVYVWFDALASYVSALGYGSAGSAAYDRWWKRSHERIHVIGKGILRFHAVFWPAFLASAGEPGPTRVHVHPYLSLEGAKLSKSSGVVVSPALLAERYGTDALRWWFARDVHQGTDTDFTEARLVAAANEDLAGGVANLVNRVVTLVHRHRGGVVPLADRPPVPGALGLAQAVRASVADLDLRRGAQLVIEAVRAVNQDIEAKAPWRVAAAGEGGQLDGLLARYMASTAEIAAAIQPILPGLAGRLSAQLGRPGEHLAPPRPIFPRIQQVDVGRTRRNDALSLRLAGPSDADAVAALHADSWRRHYRGAYTGAYLDGDLDRDRRAVWSERLLRPSSRARTVLAEANGELLGFAHVVLRDDTAWGALLDNLHVRHDQKRQGIGRRLLSAAGEVVTTDRWEPPGFYLWVLHQNIAARAFYAACGGTEVETAPATPPGGDFSRLVGSPQKLRVHWPRPVTLRDLLRLAT